MPQVEKGMYYNHEAALYTIYAKEYLRVMDNGMEFDDVCLFFFYRTCKCVHDCTSSMCLLPSTAHTYDEITKAPRLSQRPDVEALVLLCCCCVVLLLSLIHI